MRELVEDYAEHPDYIDKINWLVWGQCLILVCKLSNLAGPAIDFDLLRYFIPSANPDGYAYSWEHDRMWRKTRSTHRNLLNMPRDDQVRGIGSLGG